MEWLFIIYILAGAVIMWVDRDSGYIAGHNKNNNKNNNIIYFDFKNKKVI